MMQFLVSIIVFCWGIILTVISISFVIWLIYAVKYDLKRYIKLQKINKRMREQNETV